MTESDREKIIERVKKLHAKAESCAAIGNVEEAEAFATGVQKMLMEYKLSMSVLEVEDVEGLTIEERRVHFTDVEGVGFKRRRVGWLEQLSLAVAESYSCALLSVRNTNSIIVVGERADCEVASFVITTLARTATSLGAAATRKERYMQWKRGTATNARGYYASWMTGFVIGVRKQLHERLDHMRRDTPGLAVVLARGDIELKKYMNERYKKSTNAAKMSSANSRGFNAGEEAGRSAKVDASGAIPAPAQRQKTIAEGQRRLTSGGDQ